MIKQRLLKHEGLFLFHSILIFLQHHASPLRQLTTREPESVVSWLFPQAQTLCKTMVSRICRTIGKVTGRDVIDAMASIKPRNPSGGTRAAPSVPMPPLLETAATNGGMATKAIPAEMKGISSPYSSVKRVCSNAVNSFL